MRRYSEDGAGVREEAFFEASRGCSASDSSSRGGFKDCAEDESCGEGDDPELQESEEGDAEERSRESEDLPRTFDGAVEGEEVGHQGERKGRGAQCGEPCRPFSMRSEWRAFVGSRLGAVSSALDLGLLLHDAIMREPARL